MDLPTKQKIPVGTFDEPPPADVPFLKGTGIGRSGVARLTRELTKAADFASDVLDKIDGPL